MNKKILSIIAIILGIAFCVVAVIYFIEPAKSLPSFLPGYNPNLTKHHLTHGVGTLGLGLLAFAFAWFQSGKKISSTQTQSALPTAAE